jgi:hypothetical protein
MLNQGIAMGRGGIFPRLTEEQYAKLRRSRLAWSSGQRRGFHRTMASLALAGASSQ